MKLSYVLSVLKTKANLLLYKTVLFRFGLGCRISKGVWEKQYSGNSWEFLSSADEQVHYEAIVKQVKKTGATSSMLDIGCGEGVLYNYLKGSLNKNFAYQGIDISETAITKGSARHPGVNFETVDYDFERVNGQFDLIIFNEVLYYFVQPTKMILKAINENLAPDGVVIISMCDDGSGKHDVIWKNIDMHFDVRAQQVVQNSKGWTWNIKTISSQTDRSLVLA